ncbi:MAG: FG-GAP repeat protein [Candidatus Kerfeldbacteria bacterium]|nr:FG-GAP repeat protein [Candidatus Kerfeldbacteria bacterium]
MKYIMLTAVLASTLMISQSAQAQTVSLSLFTELTGQSAGDFAGQAVASAGDINGDGFQDMLIGAPNNDTAGANAGAAYIIYGQNAQFTSPISLSDSIVVPLSGVTAGDTAGYAVAGAGDVNNDGFDDFLIGAYRRSSGAGSAYLIYGQSQTLTAVTLAQAVTAGGAEFTGEMANDQAGYAVAGAGDVNGDGYDDFLIGANTMADGGTNAGAAYIIYGKPTEYTSTSLATNDSNIVQLTGESASNLAGAAVATAGDVNFDGYADFLIGAYGYNSTAGAAYLVYGGSTKLTNASLASTVRFSHTVANASAGYAVASAGDINSDSYADFLIGAYNASGAKGATYVLYGQATVWTSATLAASSIIVELTGETAGDSSGYAVAGVGDANGDGFDDFAIGAWNNDDGASNSGAAYLVLGQDSTLTSGDVSAMIELTGVAASDAAGIAVATSGDVNADGYPDILIGARSTDTTGTDAGSAYLAYMYIDADGDGEGSPDAIFPGTDCDDSDDSVSEEQTYYVDADGDGLGTSETAVLCSSTPPAGYSDNSNDTDDTVVNNGVEIDDDQVDNDGDGEIDEHNTITENGAHPGYGTTDPSDPAAYASNVLTIAGTIDGDMLVTFADNSVYQYDVFTGTTTQLTKVSSYQATGYIVVLQAQGQKLALVNVYNGEVFSSITLSKTNLYSKTSVLLKDARSDHSVEVVVTSRQKAQVLLTITKVNLTKEKLKRKSLVTLSNKAVAPNKTKVKKSTISLRTKKGQVLQPYRVTKKYKLKAA